ncbi:MAG: hypothetical protein DRQ97_08575 [Gammaproteobacteria bacterium]|nr:MAG: hypothetical protein DRQ97_08575 [Gammaproteobacteria bacterium]
MELKPNEEVSAVAEQTLETVATALHGFHEALIESGASDYIAWLVDAQLQEALAGMRARLENHLP